LEGRNEILKSKKAAALAHLQERKVIEKENLYQTILFPLQKIKVGSVLHETSDGQCELV